MDLGLIHGIWSLLILIIFIGIVAFVWNRNRREHYDRASRIPFDHDDEIQRDHSQNDEMSKDNNV